MTVNRDAMEELAEKLDAEAIESSVDENVDDLDVDQAVNAKMDELLGVEEGDNVDNNLDNIDNEAELVELKVNGETVEVPRDEVIEAGIATLQKETAAEARLREAAERAEELRIKEEQILEREAQLRELEESLTAGEPTDLGKEFAQAIFDDEDKVAQVISDLDRRVKAVSEAERRLTEQLEKTKVKEQQEVIQYYHTKYEDIANDPDMHVVFNSRLARITAENPNIPATEAIDQAASAVKERFTVSRETKEKLARHPSPRNVRRPGPEPIKEETLTDVIEEMRQSRARPY